MGKIIYPTPIVESIHELAQEHEAVFYFEALNNEITLRPGLTPMGYDDEIGLWEELLHRGNRSRLDTD